MLQDSNSLTELSNKLSLLTTYIKSIRRKERTNIPKEHLDAIINLFSTKVNILLNFNKYNPLSVMETITLALYMVLPRQIDIAQLLFNSVGTIKSYLYRIYIKLEATKRSDAINKAIKLGIIQRI